MKYQAQGFEVQAELARVKNEGLVLYGKAQAIRLINSLLDGKNENIPNVNWQLSDHSPKKIFSRNKSKIISSQGFLFILKFSENCPKTRREFSEK